MSEPQPLGDTSNWSLKRLAWAYGTAEKGSEGERKLEEDLRARLREGEPERDGFADGEVNVPVCWHCGCGASP